MKLSMESTTKQITVNGLICRVWEGTSEGGEKIYMIVARMMAAAGTDLKKLSPQLQENKEPSPEVSRMPDRISL